MSDWDPINRAEYRRAKAKIELRMADYGQEWLSKWIQLRGRLKAEGYSVFDAWEMAGCMIDREVSGDHTLRPEPRSQGVREFIDKARSRGVPQMLDGRMDIEQFEMDEPEKTQVVPPAIPASMPSVAPARIAPPGWTLDGKLVSAELFKDKPACSTAGAIEWVRENLWVSEASPESAPSAEAWGMLVWARGSGANMDKFMATVLSKHTVVAAAPVVRRVVDETGDLDERPSGNTVADLAARLAAAGDFGSTSDADPDSDAG